jgi:tagaturonate reductase
VLELARRPSLELVFSNTTEVGIVLDEGDAPDLAPPRSFPGKLTRFLYERAVAFDYDPAKGVVVLPCELIEDNGRKLREIVLTLADRWSLGTRFAEWIAVAVPFCNTLVDRIVPGAPVGADAERLRASLGYVDGLTTTCEVYRLFVIEGDAALRARLPFVDADTGIVVTEDIAAYRERKVRLLNGTHTAMVPAALLAGCETVREAVEHPLVGRLLDRILFDEIAPTLAVPGALEFARAVRDRFANPFVRHALIDITLQGTMKTRVRLVPLYERYGAQHGDAPPALAFGFAAFVLFSRGDVQARRREAGLAVPADDQGSRVATAWNDLSAHDPHAVAATVIGRVVSDVELWETDLARVPGFAAAATIALAEMLRAGVPAALEASLGEATVSPHA